MHLFGNVAPVAEIEALGVPVLEDAAQAAGSLRDGAARRARSATAATFSFFPSKNLGCLGDGGAVTTNDDEIAERVRLLRFHGSRDKVTLRGVGYNSRLDELQAGVLRMLLPELDGWAAGRRRAAAAYEAAGLGEIVALPVTDDGVEAAWHLYVVRHERADELHAALREAGIGSKPYYRAPAAPPAADARLRRGRRAARHRRASRAPTSRCR